MKKLLKKEINAAKYFIFFKDNKKWIINSESLALGMDMYQPSTSNGKKAKYLINRFPQIAEKKGIIKSSNYSINKEIEDKIKDIYKIDNCILSFYKGDDSTWQNDKMTIQVCEKKGSHRRIVGYVKITDNDRVKLLLDNEVKAIKKLSETDYIFISNILFSGQVGDYYILAQDTNKTSEKSLKYIFNRDIVEIIKNITDKTLVDTTYEESDIYYYIDYLKKIDVDIYKKDVLNQAIKYIEERLEEESIDYSFFHGDFTPWNIYENYKMNYIIDLEYSAMAMPRYMDVFHYMTQYAFLAKQGDVGTAVGLFRNKRKMLCDYIGKPELICAMYLLYIISFYMQRVDEFKEDETYKNRVDFLEYIINRNFKK